LLYNVEVECGEEMGGSELEAKKALMLREARKHIHSYIAESLSKE
jgi:hypothetical protein